MKHEMWGHNDGLVGYQFLPVVGLRGWSPLHYTTATIENPLDVVIGQVKAIDQAAADYVVPPWRWHTYFRDRGLSIFGRQTCREIPQSKASVAKNFSPVR